MRFLILRILTHSELGMFHEYRRQKKEGSKQRAVNFDWDVVDRVFPAAKDSDNIEMELKYDTDQGVAEKRQWLKRQEKNWRLEGNCPKDKCYSFVESGCLFAMEVDAGVTPAIGSWAVFPKNHAVTISILAEGESSKLVKSAMISLHDEEGERTWSILADSRPDLFRVKKGGTVKKTTKGIIDKKESKALPPSPKRLVEMLARVGHTMPSAVADLVDNAISADATDIEITFGRPDAGHGRWISIADNGKGMSSEGLDEAMRIGGSSDYDPINLGKFGFGLKGASWSQTKIFTVATKTAGNPPHHLTWDADAMEDWVPKSDPMDSWEEKATEINENGTVVLWKEMRPPQTMPTAKGLDPHTAEIMALTRHLALVFHRFLEGTAAGRKQVHLSINGIPVEPNNPVGHPLTSAYDAKSIKIPTETKDVRVRVGAYLLPSEDEIGAFHGDEGPEAVRKALDLIGLYGKRNETQGLFIYRLDRLIKWGGWHEMWATNDEKTKLARVVVDFNRDLDDSFKINISKQLVQIPQQLQAEIKRIAEIARKDSQKKYRTGGPVPPSPKPPLPGQPIPPAPAPVSGAQPTIPSAAPPPAANPTTPPTRTPSVAVKTVKTDKFVWKVTTGITGTLDVQVSDIDPNLLALVNEISSTPRAIARLADFLTGLDQVDIQKSLLARKRS